MKSAIVLSFLILLLLTATVGCVSEPTQPAATVTTAGATPAELSTATPSSVGQIAGMPTPYLPIGAGQKDNARQTSGQEPTATPATPISVTPTVLAATPTARPEATATSTPLVVRVSRSFKERNAAPDVSEADLQALAGGNNAFAFDLYGALAGAEGNLFFSPHSISTALAMAYAGARGETERQMAETLRFNLPQDRLHPAFNALDLSLGPKEAPEDGSGFRLNVANSVWGQEKHGFLPDFLDTLAVNYGDEVRPVDFRSDPEEARILINDWVSEATEERIRNLIPQDAIDRYTRMVLANAIYFKAAWRRAFDEHATAPRPFYRLDGSELEVPMMQQQSNLRYVRGEGYQAVELPYEGGDVVMTILLPDSGRFEEIQDALNGRSVQAVHDSLDWELVRLTMPKFHLESTFSLSDTLMAMGMPDAFDGEAANFSGMDGLSCRAKGDICLLISDVLHKAFVSVDEAGTEAAAATAVITGVTKAVFVEPEPIELVVDRPFIFLIRHRGTGTILFLGRVLEP